MVNQPQKYQVIIVGGGLAGLTSGLHLSNHGISVLLIEKNTYPNHKVCGEYVSNEVLNYLNWLGVDPLAHGAIPIRKFQISTHDGATTETDLPLGGFGMSRYALDLMLFEKVKDQMDVVFDQVEQILFENDEFTIRTNSKSHYKAEFVIGAFGKRSNLDVHLKREFIQNRSSWLAVKAHYEYEFPEELVTLHNFEGGYCGLSKVETGAVNACYLVQYKAFKEHSGITDFQNSVMIRNPHLAAFFKEAKPLFDRPLSIAQVSFQSKNPIDNHVFMVGDSAGLIHPLCGNGMAMAMHGAKLISEILVKAFKDASKNRNSLELAYSKAWRETFGSRLYYGRMLQRLLLSNSLSHWGVQLVKNFPALIPKLISKTHGSTF
ncbi:MAG: NAD(P)/FAD-dependent oxidoreductase [Flavobacteriaceae bacterium]|nr:NAD(P)/FAD-dependent oxidoreductase [Flavobacteriaceae bacterium]